MRKKTISAALALAIFASLLNPALALGTYCGGASAALAENVRLAEGVFYTDARQEEHYITYTPNEAIKPVVVYGRKMTDKGDFKAFASLLEEKGMNVVCGVNGDYYVVATGLPVGVAISEGRLLASDDGNLALGFRADGTAFFGKPAIAGKVYIKTETYRLGGVNRALAKGDYYLYTGDYGPDTGAGVPTTNVVLSYPEGTDCLRPSCALELTVESVFDSEEAAAIPEGKLVMSLVKDSDAWRALGMASLAPGDSVRLEISCDPAWSGVEYATGSLYRLVENGVKASGLDKIDDSFAPRTAAGIKPDGTLILYTVDGRQSGYSKGLTLSQVADRLLELGCTEAAALDGGGSTNIQARYAGEQTYGPVNSPSLGREREVTSYIMLAASGQGGGEPRTLSIRPFGAVMLAGASLRMTAGACDETGRPVPTEGQVVWSAEGADISPEGVLAAPEKDAEATVTAVYGSLSDSVAVRVITTPDQISVVNEETGKKLTSLTLEAGQTAELSARALWRWLEVSAEDGDFAWSVSGDIGSIDGDGTLTASRTGGSGYVTVSAGGCVFELAVAVKTAIMTGEDFESAEGGVSEGVEWSREISPDYVRYGRASLKAEYDLSEGPAEIPLGLEWAKVSRYVAFWVYGDGSGNQICVRRGGELVPAATLDFTGWRQFTVAAGANGGISGLAITGSGSGTVWLDQILLTDYDTPDLEAPYLTLGVNKLMVSGSVRDACDGILDASCVTLTLDGEPIPFQYDELTGEVYAAVEESGEIRRLTLTARDRSGNVHSVSASTEGTFETVFADAEGHWASDYINYMHKLGVVNGFDDGKGGLSFKPDALITRAQFAAMICRWMKLDTDACASRTLDFADAGEIPAWAVPYVKAACALGLIKGVSEGGALYFRPNDTLTRAQAMTILGRTLEGGRMSADLCFEDTDRIPDWALGYVSKLVFAGVIRGYDDNTLRPGGGLTRAQVCKMLTELT